MTETTRTGTAFIAVDVQPGFCEGGSLPVEGGNQVASRIASWLEANRDRYDAVVATRDYHIDPGEHFSDAPDYRESWPVHCVAGTPEAELHPALAGTAFDAVFDKGAYAPAYSGFEASSDGVSLAEWLRQRGITTVEIGGLATDYCVAATARDAVAEGFDVRVRKGLIAGVAPDTSEAALEDLDRRGVAVVAA